MNFCVFLLSAWPQASKFRVRLYRAEFSHSLDPQETSSVHRSTSERAVPEGTTQNPWRPAVRETDMPDRLLDHLIGTQQDRLRYRQTKRLGGLKIHGHLKLGRILQREIARLRAAKNAIDIGGGATNVV